MGNSSETSVDSKTEKHFSSQPVGYLLSKFGIVAIVAGLVVAAWYGMIVVVVLLGLVLSAAGLSKLWSRFSLRGVSYQRILSEHRVFPGESVELKLRLVNRKILPLPWIQVDDEIPLGFSSSVPLAPAKRPGNGLLSKTAALLWYTGVSWRHRLHCDKRGYYQLGPTMLTSGDIFGFYPRSATEPLMDHIIVYPKIFPIAQLGIPSVYPLGETKYEKRIFEDPSRVIGVRDYNPYDSLKRIHWKASARHMSLQSKVYEPTTTLKVALFLAVDSFQYHGTFNYDEFEMGISVAASIANYVSEQGNPVGAYLNTRLADSGQSVRISPNSSESHLVSILEALAKTTFLTSLKFEEFLQDEMKGLPWGTTLVFIMARPSPSLTQLLVSLKEDGHKLLVLQVGEPGETRTEHTLPWHNIGQASGFMHIFEAN